MAARKSRPQPDAYSPQERAAAIAAASKLILEGLSDEQYFDWRFHIASHIGKTALVILESSHGALSADSLANLKETAEQAEKKKPKKRGKASRMLRDVGRMFLPLTFAED